MVDQGPQQGMEGRQGHRVRRRKMAVPQKNGLCQIQGSRTTYVHIYLLLKGSVAELCSLQRLGECLGKGAFGSVYKAFNWGTGEAVAIKQIKIADLPRSELRMIEVVL
jgi:hypothetical protein